MKQAAASDVAVESYGLLAFPRAEEVRLIIPAAFAAWPGDSLQILMNREVKLPGAAATAVEDEAARDKEVFGS